MVERIPLEKAEEVFAKMMAGQARFRMGLDPSLRQAAVQHRDQGKEPMPMIDVYAEADPFSGESLRVLGTDLTQVVLRAEGVANPAHFTSRTGRRKIAIASHREEGGSK